MYVLITPAKDEEAALPDVIRSVIEQTVKPLLWLIVDDGSTDNTSKIIKDFELTYNWIKSVRLPPRDRDITYHYSYVCKEGFDSAIQYCEKNIINFDFLALLDADTILEPGYFEKLINEFDKDSKLGIASGGIYHNINGNIKWRKSSERLPAGTGRIWAKNCFLETGGYAVEPSPDSISNVKALIHGWNIKQFKYVVATQTRLTSSAEGLWNGYKANGFMAYYLNTHPLLVILNIIYFSFKKPYYVGIPYMYGYLSSLIRKEQKIDDDAIKEYYWNTKLKEYGRMCIRKFISFKSKYI